MIAVCPSNSPLPRTALVIFCLGLFAFQIPSQANDTWDHRDAFEYPNLVSFDHSPLFSEATGYFDVRDLFGGFFGNTEFNGEIVFADGPIPPNFMDWVEFETVQAVP